MEFRAGALPAPTDVVVVISANAEWKPARVLLGQAAVERSPFGEFISTTLDAQGRTRSVVYFHGGWGKISAASSAQYAIDRWAPRLLVNLGTCGGFEGSVRAGDLLLVTKTVVYDIIEMMGDADAAVADYTTTLDLAWLKKPFPERVLQAPLVSADRDIQPADIPKLRTKYGAVAGDWESGAIAFTARTNGQPCLILRAVSDVVGAGGGDVYGKYDLYEKRTAAIMERLLKTLPGWIAAADSLFK